MKRTILPVIIVLIFTAIYGRSVFIRDNFDSLKMWKPLTFPKIKNHSRYSVIKENGKSVLKAESSSSASGLIYKNSFNVYDYPVIRWRWKVDNVYRKGNAGTKSGDDYPMRIYVVFRYNPEKAGIIEKARYNAAKLIYGEYPPHSSLNYIWANRKHKSRIITSAYTGRAKMIIMQEGKTLTGNWITEKADVLADYRKAFGEDPPRDAGLAVMSDSDNTGESTTAYIDFIEAGN